MNNQEWENIIDIEIIESDTESEDDGVWLDYRFWESQILGSAPNLSSYCVIENDKLINFKSDDSGRFFGFSEVITTDLDISSIQIREAKSVLLSMMEDAYCLGMSADFMDLGNNKTWFISVLQSNSWNMKVLSLYDCDLDPSFFNEMSRSDICIPSLQLLNICSNSLGDGEYAKKWDVMFPNMHSLRVDHTGSDNSFFVSISDLKLRSLSISSYHETSIFIHYIKENLGAFRYLERCNYMLPPGDKSDRFLKLFLSKQVKCVLAMLSARMIPRLGGKCALRKLPVELFMSNIRMFVQIKDEHEEEEEEY